MRLTVDLKNLLSGNVAANNPLIPSSLNSVIIPDHLYNGINDQVGCIMRHDDDHNNPVCSDYGELTSDFIAGFLESTNHQSGLATKKNLHLVDMRKNVFAFSVTGLEYYGSFYILANIVGLFIVIANMKDDYNDGPWFKKDSFPFPLTLFMFILLPLTTIVLFCMRYYNSRQVSNAERNAQKVKLQAITEANAKEQERLKNHPLARQLLANKQYLAELQELARQYPKDQEVLDALSTVKTVVAELEKFPDKVSEQSATKMAASIKKMSEGALIDAQALLEARNELEI